MHLDRHQALRVNTVELALQRLDGRWIHLVAVVLLCVHLHVARRAPDRHLQVQGDHLLLEDRTVAHVRHLPDEGIAIGRGVHVLQRLSGRALRVPFGLDGLALCPCPEGLACTLLNLIAGVHEVLDRRDEILAVVAEGGADADIEVEFAGLLQLDEILDHLQRLHLLALAHGVELLEETGRVLAESLVLLRSKLHVVREVRLLRKLDAMKGQVREAAQGAHSNLILVCIALGAIVVALREPWKEHVTVGLSAKGSGLQ
mmetsp:Transcript_144518/g.402657  ORF Transcript_144518/g.402657 Transcript_144518/m.402657 type:complete len:258 (+) Transcript_144518:955-1728(+)